VSATVADCCDCLFPHWNGCNSFNHTLMEPTQKTRSCSEINCENTPGKICCNSTSTANCQCDENGHAKCNCSGQMKRSTENCASIVCGNGPSHKCCPAGKTASCVCAGHNLEMPMCYCR
jgi:hypothetical protein